VFQEAATTTVFTVSTTIDIIAAAISNVPSKNRTDSSVDNANYLSHDSNGFVQCLIPQRNFLVMLHLFSTACYLLIQVFQVLFGPVVIITSLQSLPPLL